MQRSLTVRTRTVMPLNLIVNEVNTTVRSWVGYFHVRNCSTALSDLRWHLEERLRTQLRKRYKIRDRNRVCPVHKSESVRDIRAL